MPHATILKFDPHSTGTTLASSEKSPNGFGIHMKFCP